MDRPPEVDPVAAERAVNRTHAIERATFVLAVLCELAAWKTQNSLVALAGILLFGIVACLEYVASRYEKKHAVARQKQEEDKQAPSRLYGSSIAILKASLSQYKGQKFLVGRLATDDEWADLATDIFNVLKDGCGWQPIAMGVSLVRPSNLVIGPGVGIVANPGEFLVLNSPKPGVRRTELSYTADALQHAMVLCKIKMADWNYVWPSLPSGALGIFVGRKPTRIPIPGESIVRNNTNITGPPPAGLA